MFQFFNFYSIKQIAFHIILYNGIYNNWGYSLLRKTHEQLYQEML